MILLVDNYDSFTYNLVQMLPKHQVHVLRNDHPDLLAVAQQASGILLSPGPGRPEEAGKLMEVIRKNYQQRPILGICLGHQAIGSFFGAQVVLADQCMHGKQSLLTFQDKEMFKDFPAESPVMRYHSLMLEEDHFPSELEVTARSSDCIMAFKHRHYPVYGIQFHPESYGTSEGQRLIKFFMQKVGE